MLDLDFGSHRQSAPRDGQWHCYAYSVILLRTGRSLLGTVRPASSQANGPPMPLMVQD